MKRKVFPSVDWTRERNEALLADHRPISDPPRDGQVLILTSPPYSISKRTGPRDVNDGALFKTEKNISHFAKKKKKENQQTGRVVGAVTTFPPIAKSLSLRGKRRFSSLSRLVTRDNARRFLPSSSRSYCDRGKGKGK